MTTHLDFARYHGWDGRLTSPWLACLAIVRVALLQVFRRKLYWIVLALGLFQFLVHWSMIYAITQLPPEFPLNRGRILQAFGFAASPEHPQDSGFIIFMDRQNVVVMVLLAFAGSLLVGADFRMKSLPFYLSRRIDRRHYLAGKLLAISAIVSLLTTAPALLLYLEYGAFTSSFDYWLENWRIPISVLAYGAVLCVVNSVLLAAVAAYLQRAAPIAITWSSLFVIPGRLGSYLRQATDNPYWRLLDPVRDMRYVGRMCFGAYRDETERQLAWWALLILSVLCAAALVLLVRRVRSVEIVE